MNKWADHEYGSEHGPKELVRFAVTGRGEEWGRLQERIFVIVDSIVARVQASTDIAPDTANASAEIMKDLSAIAAKWARAKVERPSLENEKLRAEIASEFAEAKRRHAEALKAEAEARKIDMETKTASLVGMLDLLERLLKLTGSMAHITFQQVGQDGHLLIGPRPEQLGPPGRGPQSD